MTSIRTLYGLDLLGTPKAFLLAFAIGIAFGFALERAGFSSSRRLAGIFYFRDMAVLKVMFTGVITAMLGLSYFLGMGWVQPDQVYLMPSIYGAQIVGGLLFGVGFVMGGWCPGTAAAGLGAGRIDALVFLGGSVGGSILYNELYAVIRPLENWGNSGTSLVYDALGLSRAGFAFLFTLVALGCFWGAEYVEKRVSNTGPYLGSRFLKAFSVVFVILAVGLFSFSGAPSGVAGVPTTPASAASQERSLLESIDAAEDHFEPEELADRLMAGERGLLLIDVRTPGEYTAFHLRGAVNVPITELDAYLSPRKNQGLVVLYSNGMTHPAQARDALARLGHRNVYLLTDGLKGFMERCLKPVSLRSEPLPDAAARKVQSWRAFFLAEPVEARGEAVPAARGALDTSIPQLPGLVETDWLEAQLGKPGLKILDVREQPAYSTSHVPGARRVSVEHFRGCVGGIPSSLLPAPMLAEHLSLLGIGPDDLVVIVPEKKVHDATLTGMVFERVGHTRYAILNGGFDKWAAEKRRVDTVLPSVEQSGYPVRDGADRFSVDAAYVLRQVGDSRTVIVDVRPADYYTGKKSDEARAGHIPGAVNRTFSDDVVTTDAYAKLKPPDELAAAYAKLIPARDTPVIVHCRTGHQASQTYFVLVRLLGYTNVRWYDAGWTEWAARPELPVE